MTTTEQKILNGIKYFVQNTKNVGRTKLFKLLYFWDFDHFRKYGYSVTGYNYYTFKFGPVPKVLFNDIIVNKLPSFLDSDLLIIDDSKYDEDDGYKKFKVVLKNKSIDLDWLSKNELNSLKEIAEIYQEATAKEMVKISHWKNSPWEITEAKDGMDKPIDYFLNFDESNELDKTTFEERYNLQRELLADGRI